jgi:hypothetical protein
MRPNRRVWNTPATSRDPRHGISSYEVVDARRKFMLIAGAVIALVLLAVLARVRGAGFDLAMDAGER